MESIEKEFELLGKEILKHKYLYYIKAETMLTDHQYDELERKYVALAKKIEVEPAVHMICEWPEKWAGTLIDYPHTHPWAAEIEKENN